MKAGGYERVICHGSLLPNRHRDYFETGGMTVQHKWRQTQIATAIGTFVLSIALAVLLLWPKSRKVVGHRCNNRCNKGYEAIAERL